MFEGESLLYARLGIESMKVGTGLSFQTTAGAAMAGAELARERLGGEEMERVRQGHSELG